MDGMSNNTLLYMSRGFIMGRCTSYSLKKGGKEGKEILTFYRSSPLISLTLLIILKKFIFFIIILTPLVLLILSLKEFTSPGTKNKEETLGL